MFLDGRPQMRDSTTGLEASSNLLRGLPFDMNALHVSGGLPYKSMLDVDRRETVNEEVGLTNRGDDCRPL